MFAPIVYLHPKEEYLPCTIEYYCAHSSLWDGKEVSIPEGKVSPNRLPTGDGYEGWHLDIDQDFRHGVDGSAINDVPFYVNIVEKDDVYQIFYIFLYAYNGPFWLCGIPESIKKCACCSVGAHQADIEHITVEVEKEAYQAIRDPSCSIEPFVRRVYFAAHGTHDGQWIKKEDLKWDHGKILCYSARHSHASYQHEGTICRCLGCISDHTGRGLRWSPRELVNITDETKWNLFSGYLGSPHTVPTPKYHSWWGNEEETSTNWFCRFFCACY